MIKDRKIVMRIFSKGFNFSQDGPGNRLVYHLSGCNMRCPWCSNPEGMDGASGKDYSLEEILKECVSAKPLFFGGGGVTFTGGEATLQKQELLSLLKMLKRENIHTAIESNGTANYFSDFEEYIDYIIMDFKHYDNEKHVEWTGVTNETVKKNFERRCKDGRFQHIRIPLINGVNADNPRGFAEYFSKFDTSNAVFELLPYHEYGKGKWKTPYKIQNGFVDDSTLENFYKTFKEYYLTLTNT